MNQFVNATTFSFSSNVLSFFLVENYSRQKKFLLENGTKEVKNITVRYVWTAGVCYLLGLIFAIVLIKTHTISSPN